MQMLSEQQICQQALAVQDACNIGGVLNSYHEIVCSLRNIIGWEGHKLGNHPAVILFHDKLEDMLSLSFDERTIFNRFSEAYAACKKIAEEQKDEII